MNKFLLFALAWGIIWASYNFFFGNILLIESLLLGILSMLTVIVVVLILDIVFKTNTSGFREVSNSKEGDN